MDKKKNETQTSPKPQTQVEVDRFNEGIERVYRRYGNDVSAFARDVQRDIAKNAQILRSGAPSED